LGVIGLKETLEFENQFLESCLMLFSIFLTGIDKEDFESALSVSFSFLTNCPLFFRSRCCKVSAYLTNSTAFPSKLNFSLFLHLVVSFSLFVSICTTLTIGILQESNENLLFELHPDVTIAIVFSFSGVCKLLFKIEASLSDISFGDFTKIKSVKLEILL
jgi:hypothetical protein